MADLRALTQDPNYVKANPATKRAIFDKYAPTDPNYAKASPATQKAIRQKFGVEPITAPAAPAPTLGEQAAEFGRGVVRGAASTADIIAESVPGTLAMISYPFQRAAGYLTGQTAEDVAASQERVLGTVAQPIGRMTGVAETPGYQENALREGLTYIANNMDKGADFLSKATGLPKSDVTNMMQVVLSATPAKVPGGKTARKVTTATINKMRDVIDPKTKFYMDIAEGKGSALVAAARSPQAEIIPGVRPTFAQATADVGLPRVAAVGEQAAKIQPTEAIVRRDVQEAGRVGELKKIEQTPQARKTAVKARERTSEPLYLRAEKAGNVVDVTPTLAYLEKLIDENPGNPELLAELRRIGKGLTDEYGNARVNAKEISSALDGIKTAIGKEENKNIKGQLTTIKDQIVKAIPAMKQAQTAFRKGSKPINQMDVGKFLREKLESPVPEGTQRAGVFAQAVREAPQTIKRALSGQPRYKELTEVLSPTQKASVDAVLMDLSRDARVKELAQLGSEAAPKLREPAGKATLPPLLNRIATIANEIVRRLEGKVNEKLALEIASEFLDADRAAAALETAMARSGRRAGAGPARRPGGPMSRIVKRAPVVTAPNTMTEENRNSMSR
jgi:hypothetical protein